MKKVTRSFLFLFLISFLGMSAPCCAADTCCVPCCDNVQVNNDYQVDDSCCTCCCPCCGSDDSQVVDDQVKEIPSQLKKKLSSKMTDKELEEFLAIILCLVGGAFFLTNGN